mmetsp:Transcript_12671/g.21018  ORF Transcript_12671/g.21018 Transcript_12671/m.21018 type:complete len:443 (+) Transcript_12671:85-1413(+)
MKRKAGFLATSPETAGLNAKPFEELRAATRKETRLLKCRSGASHIVVHKGKCVFAYSDGWANIRERSRFGVGTLCKLHGCTKPLVAAAFLTLVDKGKVSLSDPVAKYIRFSDHVATSSGGTVRVTKPATLRNLMTMTAGLGYEHDQSYSKIMKRVRTGRIANLADFCDALADVPLVATPGSRYEYSFGSDVLGRVCEVVSGQRLDKFVEESLLQPIGMNDTCFIVPAKKRKQVALLYEATKAKQQKSTDKGMFVLRPWSHPEKAPGIMSGGGGILSYEDAGMMGSARDYAHFCQMILNNGVAPNGRRILKVSTAKTLWQDALHVYSRRDGRVLGWNDAEGPCDYDEVGCSLLHTHLVFKSGPSGTKKPRQAKSMWMGGGGGTFWCVDTRRQMVVVSFTQTLGGRQRDDDDLGAFGDDAVPFAERAIDEGKTHKGKATKCVAS